MVIYFSKFLNIDTAVLENHHIA
jgi:hypothetical protein